MNFYNPEINKCKKEVYDSKFDELSSQLIAEYTVDLDMVLEFQLNNNNEKVNFMLTGKNIEIYYEKGKNKIYNKIKNMEVSHKYEKKGNYIVRIKGNLKKFSFCSENIKKVINWNYYLEDLYCAFNNCYKLEKVPNYIPNNIKNTINMFYDCKKFNSDLSEWNVSNVKYMSYMFEKCCKFNSDLSKWDVSNVQNMYAMFEGCKKFNSNISKWNVSNVEYFDQMFICCDIPEHYKPKFKN